MSSPAVLHSQSAKGAGSQEYGTDPETFAAIDSEFGFELDAAALEWSAKCPRYYGPDEVFFRDSISGYWAERCRLARVRPTVWLNPPYNRGTMVKWITKVIEESKRGCTVCVFVAMRPETKWYRMAWDSLYCHEERRGLCREIFVDPDTHEYVVNEKTGKQSKAGFPQVMLVFRPLPRATAFPVPSYGFAKAGVT